MSNMMCFFIGAFCSRASSAEHLDQRVLDDEVIRENVDEIHRLATDWYANEPFANTNY